MVVTKSAFELLDLLDALDEESGESLAAPIHLKSIREAITRYKRLLHILFLPSTADHSQAVPIEPATKIAAGPIAPFASGLALDLGHLARHFAEAFVCRGPQLAKGLRAQPLQKIMVA